MYPKSAGIDYQPLKGFPKRYWTSLQLKGLRICKLSKLKVRKKSGSLDFNLRFLMLAVGGDENGWPIFFPPTLTGDIFPALWAAPINSIRLESPDSPKFGGC